MAGDLKAKDFKIGCHVKLVAPTSWWGLDTDKFSYTEMHRALVYGFEISWMDFACHDCGNPAECYFDSSGQKLRCCYNFLSPFGITCGKATISPSSSQIFSPFYSFKASRDQEEGGSSFGDIISSTLFLFPVGTFVDLGEAIPKSFKIFIIFQPFQGSKFEIYKGNGAYPFSLNFSGIKYFKNAGDYVL
ncbi:Receptor protein kinase [Spatholobus suberectus]|nr:Receptor protein kinase [Spatholobus suberectus]